MQPNDARNSGSPWIRLRNADFFHGRRQVLRDVSLDLFPGRHYVIAGPNGAGKSTLLDLLVRLRTPASGEAEVMGRPLKEYEPAELARLAALAPQEYRLGFAFTIREFVAMGRRPHLGRWGILGERDWEIVDRAVAAMHLGHLAHRPVTALSGGERRRCVAARALAQDTPILLLDEPCAGLDIAQALSLMQHVRTLAEGGVLAVTVSHDLNLAGTFAHEAVFLKDGRVEAAGPVAEVFTGPVLSRVYGTEAQVARDVFGGGYAVSFRLPAAGTVPPQA